MNTEETYESELKKAAEEVGKVMDELKTEHDGVQIHVNHFGQWVAKYKTKKGVVHYAFGPTLLIALNNLRENPSQE